MITSPTEYPWWGDPDYERDGQLIGAEKHEAEYNPDEDPDWGKHEEDTAA